MKIFKLILFVALSFSIQNLSALPASGKGSGSGLKAETLKDSSVVFKIWQGRKIPGAGAKDPIKIWGNDENDDLSITNVSEADIRFFKAESAKPTPAVVICPGGAYGGLAYGKEGTALAKLLAKNGMSAFVLKYRVPQNREGAYADAQRALRFIRAHAKELNIDPFALGMAGFSAGGHLSCRTASNYKEEIYAAEDMIDKFSAKPDFLILIYPAYTGSDELKLQPDIKVDENTPPCFIAQTMDDGHLKDGLTFFLALRKAGVKLEGHFYEEGGHGYGMRDRQELPMRTWPQMLLNWLAARGLVNPEAKN